MGKVHSKPPGAAAQPAAPVAASQANASAPPLERRTTPVANAATAKIKPGATQVDAEPVRSRPLSERERQKMAKQARELLASATTFDAGAEQLRTLLKAVRVWRALPQGDVDPVQIGLLSEMAVDTIVRMTSVAKNRLTQEMLQLPFECAACLGGEKRTQLLASIAEAFCEYARDREKYDDLSVRPEFAGLAREALGRIRRIAQDDPSQAATASNLLVHLQVVSRYQWHPMALEILSAAEFCVSQAQPDAQLALSSELQAMQQRIVSFLADEERSRDTANRDGYRNRLAALAHCLAESGGDLAKFKFPVGQEWFATRMAFLAGRPVPENQIATVIFHVTGLPKPLSELSASYIREHDLDATIAAVDQMYPWPAK
jgi:hypothetical protein